MKNRKSGFTLIELLVVLVIITIISSVTFGAFRSISDGNKRTSCQSNLAQIYKSVRLYAQDFDGKFPYLNPVTSPSDDPLVTPINTAYVAIDSSAVSGGGATPAGGIGLWGLYTFRVEGYDTICPNNDVNLPLSDDGGGIGLSGYVRSPKIFHCPADRFEKVVQYRPPLPKGSACTATTDKVANAKISFTDNAGNVRLNPSYLSYQANDDSVAIPSAGPRMTYSSFRQPETGNRVRQLSSFTSTSSVTSTLERPIDQTTIITWCRFHRSLNTKDNPDGITNSGSRNFDNVLFSDGTVQSLPISQTVTGSTNACTGWQRVRREVAASDTAVNCQ